MARTIPVVRTPEGLRAWPRTSRSSPRAWRGISRASSARRGRGQGGDGAAGRLAAAGRAGPAGVPALRGLPAGRAGGEAGWGRRACSTSPSSPRGPEPAHSLSPAGRRRGHHAPARSSSRRREPRCGIPPAARARPAQFLPGPVGRRVAAAPRPARTARPSAGRRPPAAPTPPGAPPPPPPEAGASPAGHAAGPATRRGVAATASTSSPAPAAPGPGRDAHAPAVAGEAYRPGTRRRSLRHRIGLTAARPSFRAYRHEQEYHTARDRTRQNRVMSGFITNVTGIFDSDAGQHQSRCFPCPNQQPTGSPDADDAPSARATDRHRRPVTARELRLRPGRLPNAGGCRVVEARGEPLASPRHP